MKSAFFLSLGLTAASAFPVQAADIAEGKALVDENCQRCHGSEVYTRADRRVTSMDGLTKQVRRCELSLGLSWFDDQVDAAGAYLNDTYYKFK